MARQPARTLPRGEVHLWTLDLDQPPGAQRHLAHILDAEERARAGRLVSGRDRSRFVCAHGWLRRVLGSYLGTAPARLRFRRAPGGKPRLRTGGAQTGVRFNLSHSDSTALLAVALGRDVGVDLERVRPDRDVEGIAEHFFSPAEVAALRSLPSRERVAGFYRGWTRKEAYIKARGDPFPLPLHRFAVSLVPGAPAALLHSVAGAGEPARWSMRGLTHLPGYAAALVVEGSDWTLRAFAAREEEPPPRPAARSRSSRAR